MTNADLEKICQDSNGDCIIKGTNEYCFYFYTGSLPGGCMVKDKEGLLPFAIDYNGPVIRSLKERGE